MKNTVLVAHCDDEFLFMFPALQRRVGNPFPALTGSLDRIICITSDINNADRQWCRERKHAFMDICKWLGVEGVCLDYCSDFYKFPKAMFNSLIRDVHNVISDSGWIFTHNAWGEYGHLDHIVCNQVARSTRKTVYTTDICFDAGWSTVKTPFHQGPLVAKAVENDLEFHKECMRHYHNRNAMGWKFDPIVSANVVEVYNGN